MVKTASSLKNSRGISSSLGLAGVGMTMPKSSALPSNFGCTVKLSTFSLSSQVMNTFCAGCKMSLSLALKYQHAAFANGACTKASTATTNGTDSQLLADLVMGKPSFQETDRLTGRP